METQTVASIQYVDLDVHKEGIDIATADAVARNFRRLRALGVTVRYTIDTVIATGCIVDKLELMHSDRDFDPFEQHLGLRCVRWEG